MAERPALEAVLFDAGGTLVRLDFEAMAGILLDLGFPAGAGGLARAEVTGRMRFDARLAAALGATPTAVVRAGDTRAYFAGILEAAGTPQGLREAALDRWLARQSESGLWVRPMEGARGALVGLGRLGLRRAVVSNSDGRAEAHLRDCGLMDQIEFVIDSHRVGVEKPDPRIFHFALSRLGVAAERTLFVGDLRSVDEAGARAAGIHFVLLDPTGDYGAPGAPSVRRMDELPAWVASSFELRQAREA